MVREREEIYRSKECKVDDGGLGRRNNIAFFNSHVHVTMGAGLRRLTRVRLIGRILPIYSSDEATKRRGSSPVRAPPRSH